MTKNQTLKLLDKDQIEELISPELTLEAVRDAFKLHSSSQGELFPVVRQALTTGGVFGIKSGGVAQRSILGFKAAGFWPSNRAAGSEPHQATIMLMDPSTGRPLCLIDGNMVTTLRTGAAGAIGLRMLARSNSSALCLFGSGVQATIQLDYALRTLPGIQSVTYLTSNGKRDETFESKFSKRCVLRHSTSPNDEVSRSQVVVTATPGKAVLFDLDAVQPGTHLNCIGADTRGKRELPHGLLTKARVIVDDSIQATQIGECQWDPTVKLAEIGNLLTGRERLNRTDTEITVFDMTGIALQDLTVAQLLFEQAIARNVGHNIHWPW